MTKEYKIIYFDKESAPTPAVGDEIVFRLIKMPFLKFKKNSNGTVSEIKPDNPSEGALFSSQYDSMYRDLITIKEKGLIFIERLIFKSCTSKEQQERILSALDKVASFYVALLTNNCELAKERLLHALNAQYITQEDYELISIKLLFAEQILDK